MANVLKHRFASGKADGADASQVQPSHWNDGHLFSGGLAGDVLTRDPTDASFGAKWATPAAPPTTGIWTPIDTSGAGLTLTITSARYWKYDKLVFVSLHFAFPTTASSVPAFIGGLPFGGNGPAWGGLYLTQTPFISTCAMPASTSGFYIMDPTTGNARTNQQLSGAALIIAGSYLTA